MLTPMNFLNSNYDQSELSALSDDAVYGIVEELDQLLNFLHRHHQSDDLASKSEQVWFARRLLEVEIRSRLGADAECECSNPHGPSCVMCRIETDTTHQNDKEARDYAATEAYKWAMYYEV